MLWWVVEARRREGVGVRAPVRLAQQAGGETRGGGGGPLRTTQTSPGDQLSCTDCSRFHAPSSSWPPIRRTLCGGRRWARSGRAQASPRRREAAGSDAPPRGRHRLPRGWDSWGSVRWRRDGREERLELRRASPNSVWSFSLKTTWMSCTVSTACVKRQGRRSGRGESRGGAGAGGRREEGGGGRGGLAVVSSFALSSHCDLKTEAWSLLPSSPCAGRGAT